VYDDLWIFNTDSFAWIEPRTTGFAPSGRYGHSLTLTPDGRLLIFGGCSLAKETGYIPKYNDDIRQLDTSTMIWSRPRINGNCPTGRFGHSAALMGQDRTKLVLFGGWGKGGCQSQEFIHDARAYTTHILDIISMNWYVPRKISKKPVKHMYSHGCCLAGDNTLFMFGGWDGRQASNDFIVMNMDFGNA
jgi:N-acetylneuraminic acid mutarotase